MGFVEKLWDETVAGPSPETYKKVEGGGGGSMGYNHSSILRPISTKTPRVSRSITLLRTRSLPVSPAGSDVDRSSPSSPSSPLTPGTPSDNELRRLSRTHTPTSLEGIQDSDHFTRF